MEVARGGRWVRVFGTHAEDTFPSLAGIGLPPWWFQALQDAQLVAIVDAVYLDPASDGISPLRDAWTALHPSDHAGVVATFAGP